MSAALPIEAQAVLDFWFGMPASAEFGRSRKAWFAKDDAFDQTIRKRFGTLVEQTLRSEHDDWADDPRSALARIIVLDQFTRNAFRGTARAFAGDGLALAAASRMVGARDDESLAPFMRTFVYLPFEHAEGLAMQDESVRLFRRLVGDGDDPAKLVDFALRHRAIIERFGRFPHRNDLLGRQSTAEEIAFLAQPGSGF
jgi:uncharacterized protein (DUF924 family)